MNKQTYIPGRSIIIHAVRKFAYAMLITAILINFEAINPAIIAAAQGPCGDTYIVLPGDTIEDIADLCGTTVEGILRINPEITDPNNIYTGQIIRIPKVELVLNTTVAIAPSCGLPGQILLVVGSGFPVDTNVRLGIGQKDQSIINAGVAISDQFGRIDTSVVLPSNAAPGTTWVVIGETQISSARFAGISNEYYVINQAPDPNSGFPYVVQEGDTLRSISVKFNRDLEWILEANPQITFTTQLFPGDILHIPPQEPGTPKTAISPVCGPAETEIFVNGEDYPPLTSVNLSMGKYLVSYEPTSSVFVNPNRTFQTQLTIPGTAQIDELWVVVGSTSSFPIVRSTSNIFTVTPPKDPKSPQLYIAQPGDTLNQIAAEFGRTVAAILSVNPQITNPNQLAIGEKIIIPGQDETIILSPVSGPPLTLIQVVGVGFHPYSSVTLGLTRESIIYSIEGAVSTNVNGVFQEEYIIPTTTQPGDKWSVVAIKPDETGGEVFAKSNEFTITSPQAPLDPIITIWPPAGPPGTLLSIVGNNFPSNTEIRYSFGVLDSTPYYSTTTWTEINGTFPADLIIPMSAESGESWVVSAEVIDDPLMQTTSPEFTVVEP